MALCHGRNGPETTNKIHIPKGTSEIRSSSQSLAPIIKTVMPYADIVTICRSNRDGYTPRNYSQIIETELLELIATYNSPSAREINFIYDKSLMTHLGQGI